jgi:hypothetical protein
LRHGKLIACASAFASRKLNYSLWLAAVHTAFLLFAI